ncbi:TPA: hypothetical protein HA246_04250 [Candidatus Woesearchaeota archaeon]|nr:hypothetical protein [Candidatus Woesearchaeota archaeon]
MSSLEELRRRRSEQIKQAQLQQQYNDQGNEEAQTVAKLQQLENLVKQVLTKEALQRYSNLKVGHPDKAMNLLMIIGSAIQSNQLNAEKKVTDEELKNLLMRLTPKKREVKINNNKNYE